jgi:hypothetical protein
LGDTRALYDRSKVNECIWETTWWAGAGLRMCGLNGSRELPSHRRTAELRGCDPAVSPSTAGSPQINKNKIIFQILLPVRPNLPPGKYLCFHLIPNPLIKFPPRPLQPRLLARCGESKDPRPSFRPPTFCDVSLLRDLQTYEDESGGINDPSPVHNFLTTLHTPRNPF